MTTRCKMMIAFHFENPAAVNALGENEKDALWKKVNTQIFKRIPPEEAARLSDLAPHMDGAGGPPSAAVMASRIQHALNVAASRALGADAIAFGDPVLVPDGRTEYNIHDGVRCCGELFGVREVSGDPWLIHEDAHTAVVKVKFNWEEKI